MAHGVTAVRDTGDEIVAQTVVAHFAEARPRRCPRVFTASHLIDADPPIHRDIGFAITDPAKVPARHRRHGRLEGDDAEDLRPHRAVLSAAASSRKATAAASSSTGHLSGYPAQEAVEDGIDCLEHITSVFDFIIPPEVRKQADHRATLDLDNPQAKALIATLAKRKTMVDPTLTVFRNMLLLSDLEEVHRHPDNARMPERLRTYWDKYRQGQGLAAGTLERRRKEFRKYQDLTGRLYGEGVPLLAGTDAPEPYCPPGSSLHQELELMVESGLTPAAALQAATLHNARSLKQDASSAASRPANWPTC